MKRAAKAHRFITPSREDVRGWLRGLVDGYNTPEEASDWATEYILYDNPQIYPPIEDPVVWQAIMTISGADLKVNESTYLHGHEDFERWLREFEDSDA